MSESALSLPDQLNSLLLVCKSNKAGKTTTTLQAEFRGLSPSQKPLPIYNTVPVPWIAGLTWLEGEGPGTLVTTDAVPPGQGNCT